MTVADDNPARHLRQRSLTHPLAADLAAEATAPLTIHWLGQAGFVLRDAGGPVVLVDPYLSDSLAEKYRGTVFAHRRLMAAPIQPADFPRIDLVLITHGHSDHMDPGTVARLAEAHPDATFVVPHRELTLAQSRGVPIDRIVAAREGQVLDPVPGIRLEVVPSAHEQLDITADGSKYLGYVVGVGRDRIYHSGDCVPFDGQASRLRDLAPTVALLPVNGRDEFRRQNGVPGNFTLDEALALCEDGGVPAMVAHHWGMFEFNTVDLATLHQRQSSYEGPVRWYIPSPTTCLQG